MQKFQKISKFSVVIVSVPKRKKLALAQDN